MLSQSGPQHLQKILLQRAPQQLAQGASPAAGTLHVQDTQTQSTYFSPAEQHSQHILRYGEARKGQMSQDSGAPSQDSSQPQPPRTKSEVLEQRIEQERRQRAQLERDLREALTVIAAHAQSLPERWEALVPQLLSAAGERWAQLEHALAALHTTVRDAVAGLATPVQQTLQLTQATAGEVRQLRESAPTRDLVTELQQLPEQLRQQQRQLADEMLRQLQQQQQAPPLAARGHFWSPVGTVQPQITSGAEMPQRQTESESRRTLAAIAQPVPALRQNHQPWSEGNGDRNRRPVAPPARLDTCGRKENIPAGPLPVPAQPREWQEDPKLSGRDDSLMGAAGTWKGHHKFGSESAIRSSNQLEDKSCGRAQIIVGQTLARYHHDCEQSELAQANQQHNGANKSGGQSYDRVPLDTYRSRYEPVHQPEDPVNCESIQHVHAQARSAILRHPPQHSPEANMSQPQVHPIQVVSGARSQSQPESESACSFKHKTEQRDGHAYQYQVGSTTGQSEHIKEPENDPRLAQQAESVRYMQGQREPETMCPQQSLTQAAEVLHCRPQNRQLQPKQQQDGPEFVEPYSRRLRSRSKVVHSGYGQHGYNTPMWAVPSCDQLPPSSAHKSVAPHLHRPACTRVEPAPTSAGRTMAPPQHLPVCLPPGNPPASVPPPQRRHPIYSPESDATSITGITIKRARTPGTTADVYDFTFQSQEMNRARSPVRTYMRTPREPPVSTPAPVPLSPELLVRRSVVRTNKFFRAAARI